MMDRIIAEVERDPHYRSVDRRVAERAAGDASRRDLQLAAPDREPGRRSTAVVTYTRSGYTSLRAARERPVAPVLSITPELADRAPARAGLGRAFGARRRRTSAGVPDMIDNGLRAWRVAKASPATGDIVVIAAGMPFGIAGTTNLLHIAKALNGDTP